MKNREKWKKGFFSECDFGDFWDFWPFLQYGPPYILAFSSLGAVYFFGLSRWCWSPHSERSEQAKFNPYEPFRRPRSTRRLTSKWAITSEEEFKPKKNSSKTEEMVRWRKVIREKKKMFMFSGLAALAVIMRSIPLRPKTAH